jgi:ABC-type sugar transport system ATPase subunit
VNVIVVEELSIRQGTFALTGVSFTVPAGAYAILMGRTGIGKTTVVETIAGLRRPAAGRIHVAGRDVTHLPPAARNVGYVPQDAALFSTMTVFDNIAFALRVRNAPVKEIDRRVGELADHLGIAAILERPALALSGGEAQRVALGRALAFRPAVLLLDEPLNAVDEETRDRLVELLKGIRGQGNLTVLHVTHNRAEAELLGDTTLIFDDGRIRPAGESR